MLVQSPGIYQIPAAQYHADDGVCPAPSLSSTGARRLLETCPARFWYERQNPPAPSLALDIGTAAHEWLLEGEAWPQKFSVLPEDHDGRTKIGKARVADIEEAGKRPLRYADFAAIKAMKRALESHPFAGALFKGGKAEQSLYWKDEEFGIWCRCRPDYLPPSFVVPDYKTCEAADEESRRKAIFNYGYYQQAAWYLDGVKAVGIHKRPAFALVFQEKTPPYLVVVSQVEDIAIEWGRIRNRKAKAIFAECLKTGRWPGYAEEVVRDGLPTFATMRLEDQHARGLYELAQAPVTQAAE